MISPHNIAPLRRIIPLLFFLAGLFLLVWQLPFLPDLLGTTIMSLPMPIFWEAFSVAIAAMVFGVAYTSSAERPGPVVFLGCALLVVGLLDFGHMLSFNGMPDFVTPADREKGLHFWLAARLLFALAMVVFTLLPWRPFASPRTRYWLLAGGIAITGLVYWLGIYHQELWPRTYVAGQGLTPFKIGAEVTIIAIMLLAAGLFFRKARSPFPSYDAAGLFAALVITCLSELAFTVYADVNDIFDLLGYLYKIVAYGFICRAVFLTNVLEPFARLQEANAALNETRVQYATLAELAPVGIFRTDAAGKCLYVNDRWAEIVGLSPADAQGDGWVMALHPEDREGVSREWNRVAHEQQKLWDEFRFQRPDGTTVWVLGESRVEKDSAGQLVGHVGTITDITRRKEAESRVAQSEERLRLILDSLDALVYVADMETYELLFMNKYGRDIWGEPAGRRCWQVLQTDQTGPCSFCTNNRLLAADGAPTGVYAWEFQNTKNQHWYDCRDQAIPWTDGRLVRMEIATDITRRKQAEQELRTAKEEWERTFADMTDIITIQDADHRIQRVNRRAGEVLGVPAEDLVGRFCYEVFHGGAEPCEGCPAVFAAGDSATHVMEIVHEKLGKTFSVSASPIFGPTGELVSSIYVSRDVTELKALEGQLRQAQKMEAIGALAGGIAHDFNNILTPVLGYAEIIVEELPEGSPLAEPAQEVLKAGRRARDLVKQILSFSRQAEQERFPIEIHLVAKEVLKLLRSSLPSSIEIRQDLAPCGMVLADPIMIYQVVMNLCTNAYHAMRETGGVLAVTLAEAEIGPEDYSTALHLKPGPYLRLEVSDTGGGMPRHIVERIFEPYFTTKAKGEGTGLGLSVVHGIVTGIGGHVTVYSEPGKGTTFHVYLPKYLEKQRPEEAAGAAAPLPRGHERILVVDDETTIIELMEKSLEALGYQVTSCSDSGQALERFAAQPAGFDLVITDMTMPHLTGAELAQRLLAIRPALPVILCTGFSEIINEEKATALGIRRLLMKPVLRDELAKALREELDTKE